MWTHGVPLLLAGFLGRGPSGQPDVDAAWAAFAEAWRPPYDLQSSLMAALDGLAALVPADGYFAYAADAPGRSVTLRSARAPSGVPVVGPDYSGLVSGGVPRSVPLELPPLAGPALQVDGTAHEPYLSLAVGAQVLLRAALAPTQRARAARRLPACGVLRDRLQPALAAVLYHLTDQRAREADSGPLGPPAGGAVDPEDDRLLALVCRTGALGLGATDGYLALWQRAPGGAPERLWAHGDAAGLAAACPPRPLHEWLQPPGVACWEAPQLPGRLEAHGCAAFLFIPVQDGGARVGAVALSLAGPLAASAHTQAVRLARVVSAVLTERGLTQRWAQGRLQALLLVGDLLESQDEAGPGHSARVARLSEELAREMGLPPPDREAARLAGRLHDLGMLGIELDFRLRPGALSEAERERFHAHPALGADLLRGLPPSVVAADVVAAVRHHHERWDGRGYPDHLAGADIPLIARVVACAEVMVARTSGRAYRPALDGTDLPRVLEQDGGALFDPEVAAAATRLLARAVVP